MSADFIVLAQTSSHQRESLREQRDIKMTEDKEEDKSVIGVFGMGVMGQNLALNLASKNFKVSCYNREDEFSKRLFEALEIAKRDISNGDDLLRVFKDLNEFVDSLKKPRYVLLCFLFLSFVVVLHRSVCCSM